MPFKSEAQRRFLYARHPSVAKKFAAEENRTDYNRAGEARKEAIRRRLQKTRRKRGPKPIPEGYRNYGQYRSSLVRQNERGTTAPSRDRVSFNRGSSSSPTPRSMNTLISRGSTPRSRTGFNRS